MLTFITAVRHPLNSASYARVGRLLTLTLSSVCRQTDDRFRVIVVHNEMPEVGIEDPHISYVPVRFPAPSAERTAEIDYNTGIIDKGAKLAIGVVAAQTAPGGHVMFIDCDDLVHHRLAEYVAEQPDHPGWYSPQGYIHTIGTAHVHLMKSDFHHKCGSSGIIRGDLLPVPSELSQHASKKEVIEAVGQATLYRLLGTHGKWEDYLKAIDLHMDPLPFPAAVWQIGTGENASGNLVSSRESERISPDLTSAFGLNPPSTAASTKRRIDVAFRRVGRKVKSIGRMTASRPAKGP